MRHVLATVLLALAVARPAMAHVGSPDVYFEGGAGAYPITSQTFIVVNKDLCKAGVPGGEAAAKGVVKFVTYGLNEGQSILSQADYASLPAAILTKSKEAAKTVECNGSPIGG